MSELLDNYPLLKARLVEAVSKHIAGDTADNRRFDLGSAIPGDRRCAIAVCPWMTNWFVAVSPRNGEGAPVEGAWEHWVVLAANILAVNNALPNAQKVRLTLNSGVSTEPETDSDSDNVE